MIPQTINETIRQQQLAAIRSAYALELLTAERDELTQGVCPSDESDYVFGHVDGLIASHRTQLTLAALALRELYRVHLPAVYELLYKGEPCTAIA